MTPQRRRLVLLIVAGALIVFNLYMYLTWPETTPDPAVEAPAGTSSAP